MYVYSYMHTVFIYLTLCVWGGRPSSYLACSVIFHRVKQTADEFGSKLSFLHVTKAKGDYTRIPQIPHGFVCLTLFHPPNAGVIAPVIRVVCGITGSGTYDRKDGIRSH